MNETQWSPWRKANYFYFEKHLNRLPRTLRMVDLGAGSLPFADLFKQFKYTGVDFVAFPDVSVVCDLTKDIPLADASADIVTLSNTVEHIPNTAHLFSECHRLLKQGGIIVGTVPFLMQLHQEPYDFNRYTHFQLRRFLEETGFSNIEIVPLGSLIDTYDTMERKFFDHAFKTKKTVFAHLLNKGRRAMLKLLVRPMFGQLPAVDNFTEGYGFKAQK